MANPEQRNRGRKWKCDDKRSVVGKSAGPILPDGPALTERARPFRARERKRIPRNILSRLEPLNRISRRESALTLFWTRWSGLTSAATKFAARFAGNFDLPLIPLQTSRKSKLCVKSVLDRNLTANHTGGHENGWTAQRGVHYLLVASICTCLRTSEFQ